MDGEKGEFQALGGSLALDQKGEFQALRGTLSLDLSNCKLRNPQPAPTNSEPRNDPTLEQKQYAQGFFDALRTVQQIHNFEFEKKVLSPGFIAPIVGSELLTPLISPSSRDYQAILNAMVAKTPIMQPTVGISANPVLPTGFPTAVSAPGTASTTTSGAAPSTSATVSATAPTEPVMKVEIKEEPQYVSEDSTESDRSRSSSTTAQHSIRYISKNDIKPSSLVMDEQEKRKLDRKRARNRAAATKCRQKKIDRIQELEGMVASEKQRAQGLDMEMENLRNTLHQLQQLIQMHEQRGCARS